MHGLSDQNTAKRRKVRKGTHSCWECRRRKVKCTFASPEDAVCITCRRRGAKCASQTDLGGHDATASSTPYTELAAAFDEQSDDMLDAPIVCAPSTPLQESPITPTTLHGNAVSPNQEPVVNLGYERPTVTHESTPTPTPVDDSSAELSAHKNITQDLLRALPCQKDIRILLSSINKLSLMCYQSNYKSQDLKTYEMLKDSISMTTLLYPEAHPVLLARQMLLFAVALQYLSADEMVPGLTKHHHVIMEELAESAIKMVNMNDVLLGTLEGLENLILEGLYHIDGGNIRRAWITMRRAVMAAQLLGLHRPGQYRFKLINDQSKLDPEVMWPCIVSMERVLSLVLGLPSSTVSLSFAVQNTTSTTGQGSSLARVMMYLTAKILERNQIQGSAQALGLTREIDRELVKMTGDMPSTFWQPPSFAGLEIDSVDAFFEIRRTLDHMCYHTVVNQLHLPYILCPSHSPQSIYSRIACANASREVLTREIAIRTFNPVATCSRMGDFMALIAGMTLMLAHLVSHCQETMGNLLVHQRLSDRAIVERALTCMKSMSELHDDALAAKCAVLLRGLLAVEADAAQGHTYRAHALQRINGDGEDNSNALIINVPYVGIVRIAREGTVSMTPLKTAQNSDVLEGITIGGIGSLHVNSPVLPDHDNTDGTSDVIVAPQAATTQAINAPSTLQHATNISQLTSVDLSAQQDHMFPKAAASMDDWVLQGFDAAFFDVLMQGAGDQQPDSGSGEGWGF